MMATTSSIEWTEKTWNPLAGCTEVSPGCANCYAAVMAARLAAMGQAKYKGTTRKAPSGKTVWTGQVNLDHAALVQPLAWRKPCRVFVNSMSDLFHEDVPDEFIRKVFMIMAEAGQHTFQVLTKRAARMAEFVASLHAEGDFAALCGEAVGFPIPNVWLGVSVEDQARADERIPSLLATPAAVRFLSCEPLLEPVDVSRYLVPWSNLARVDWVIIGGESGPGARACEVDWIRSLVRQCRAAAVPAFVKQDSGPRPGLQGRIPDDLWTVKEFPNGH